MSLPEAEDPDITSEDFQTKQQTNTHTNKKQQVYRKLHKAPDIAPEDTLKKERILA
jgi:hypothetical protein